MTPKKMAPPKPKSAKPEEKKTEQPKLKSAKPQEEKILGNRMWHLIEREESGKVWTKCQALVSRPVPKALPPGLVPPKGGWPDCPRCLTPHTEEKKKFLRRKA